MDIRIDGDFLRARVMALPLSQTTPNSLFLKTKPLAATWGISVVDRSARHSRCAPSGAVWSLVLPRSVPEGPFRSLRASKLARNGTASVGAVWLSSLASGTTCIGDRWGPVTPPSLANSTLASTPRTSEGPKTAPRRHNSSSASEKSKYGPPASKRRGSMASKRTRGIRFLTWYASPSGAQGRFTPRMRGLLAAPTNSAHNPSTQAAAREAAPWWISFLLLLPCWLLPRALELELGLRNTSTYGTGASAAARKWERVRCACGQCRERRHGRARVCKTLGWVWV